MKIPFFPSGAVSPAVDTVEYNTTISRKKGGCGVKENQLLHLGDPFISDGHPFPGGTEKLSSFSFYSGVFKHCCLSLCGVPWVFRVTDDARALPDRVELHILLYGVPEHGSHPFIPGDGDTALVDGEPFDVALGIHALRPRGGNACSLAILHPGNGSESGSA